MDVCCGVEYKVFEAQTNFLHPDWDSAGYTSCGDRYKNKQTGTVTFLADAAKSGKTKILEKTKVEKILRQGRKAIGVQVSSLDDDNDDKLPMKKQNIIMAKHCVICCAGALHSPCLLMRSKFKNKHVGKHLFMHPTCGFSANFPNDESSSGNNNNTTKCKKLDTVFGAPMTAICNEFAKGPKDDGYGAKLEVPSLHNSLLAGLSPWMGPYQYKEFIRNAPNSCAMIVLQRDSGEGGVVQTDSNGHDVLVDYTLNDDDENSMIHALVKGIEMCVDNGASIINIFSNIEPLNLEKELGGGGDSVKVVDSPLVQNYLKKVKKMKLKHFAATLGNAHQMGSCRMGTSSKTSVVDEDGKLWESDNVYVMDTSIFPTALGVNPMLTVLSISHMLSTRLTNQLS